MLSTDAVNVPVKYGIFNHNGYYGIKETDWNEFLVTYKAVEYLSARQIISNAASKVANGDLSYIDEGFTIDFINSNADERTALKEYLSDKTAPDTEDIKGYLPDLITEFTKRISGSYLDHYGWDESGVKRAIIEHIADEELKSYIRSEDIAKNGLMIKSRVEGWPDWSTKTLPPAAREAAEWLILNGFDNESDVRSAFYSRQTSHMSDDGNAVENDNAAIIRVAEKYGKSTVENNETETETEKFIKVLIRRVGQEPIVETIENTLKAQQQIVGGHIEMPYNPELSKGLHIVCNDIGKFMNDPKPNVHWGDEDVLFGDILFVGIDSGGETISLTPKQIDEAKKWIADNDASEFKGNAIDLAKTEFYTDFDIDEEIEAMLDDMSSEEIDELINPKNKEEKKHIPIYTQSFAYAREHGELDQFRESLEENRICVTEIDATISANFDGAILAENIEKPLAEKFGFERMNYVLANTVQYYNNDGRYSRENKEWANGIDIFETDSYIKDSFILRSHPAIADLFVTNVRELFNENGLTKTETETANIKEEKLEDNKYIPIYTQSFAYADEHGELDEYRASRKENRTCKDEIEKAIRENWKDNHLEKGFETALIEKFGTERMAYVLANTLQQKEWDARFSRENKEWARTITVYEDKENRSNFVVDTHSVLTDAFVDRFREAMKQPQGKKEEKPEEKSAETTEPAKEKKVWLKVNVARDALIKKYEKSSFMRMPTSNPDYADYTYNIFNNNIKESRQIVDIPSDTSELSYELNIAETQEIQLTNKNKDKKTLTGKEFAELVGGTTSKDYETKKKDDEKQWFAVNMPNEAIAGKYENKTLIQLPNDGITKGFSFYVPNNFVRDDENYEDNRITVRLPEDFEITAKNKEKEELKLSAFQLFERCNDSEASEYLARKGAENGNGNGWTYFGINAGAKITDYENRTLFKMPKGEYENFFYYLPNKFVRENEEKGTLQLSLPNDLIIKLTDNKKDKKVDLTVEQFLKEVKDKSDADYNSNFQRPSESKANAFAANEKDFADKIPDEMKSRPNWCIVRTKEYEVTKDNITKTVLDKYLINCHTGKAAEIDDPTTWTDFKTACEYAKKNGGETLAYALDGKDKICCIDLDRCIDENGNYSALAKDLLSKSKGTYVERSISGKGVHIFGKTDGLDLRAFSKDGDLEFYEKSRFMAMTGNILDNSKELKNLDNTEVKAVLEKKCAKRTELKGTGLGLEGLSSMSDRDVVEKAISSKGGETFKALYNGQNLQNNHSNSDMSLMNRLAFWCNGDKEQMLRIFNTSGLHRQEKFINYYEHTVMKAIKDTSSRYEPHTENKQKPPENKKPNGNGSGGNGKA